MINLSKDITTDCSELNERKSKDKINVEHCKGLFHFKYGQNCAMTCSALSNNRVTTKKSEIFKTIINQYNQFDLIYSK